MTDGLPTPRTTLRTGYVCVARRRRFVLSLCRTTFVPLRRGGHASASTRWGTDRAGDAGRPVSQPAARSPRPQTMPSAIVTTSYRYKRPPPKKRRIVLTGSAIVTPKRRVEAQTSASEPQASGSAIVRRVKAGNDNRAAEQPSDIVTARTPRGRKTAWVDDGEETPESVKAFLARMIRPGGALPPDASE